MRNINYISLSLVLLVLSALSIRCHAAVPSPAFMAWWQELLRGGSDGPSIDGYMLDYTITDTRPLPTREEVEALRAQIGAAVGHSRKHELTDMERRLQSPPTVTRLRLWRMGSEWRWSQEPLGAETAKSGYFDQVWTADAGWQLSPSQLVAGDPATIASSIYRIDVTSSGVAADIALLFNGQLGAAAEQGLTLVPRMTSPSSWEATARVEHPNGHSVEVVAHGKWNEGLSTGDLVERVWRAISPNGNTSEERIRYEAWQSWGDGSLRLPARATVFDDGKPRQRYELQGVRTYTKSEFVKLTRVPAPTANDPIRGPVTYRSVIELKEGIMEAQEIGEDGTITTMAREGESPAGARRLLRVAGWVLAAVILVALVWYRRTNK